MSGGGGGGGGGGRGGGGMQVDTSPSPLSNADGYMSPMHANDPLQNPLNQPTPDAYQSGGFFGFGRPRGRR